MYITRVPNRASCWAVLLREELPRQRQGQDPHAGQPVALARAYKVGEDWIALKGLLRRTAFVRGV